MERHAHLPPRPSSGTSYQLPPLSHLCSSIPPPSTHSQKPTAVQSPPRPKKELTPKEMRNRMLQAERKRQWRQNQTPEQKERRKRIDADRKRRERSRLSEQQKAENRRRDAARKAAKRQKENVDTSRSRGRPSSSHRDDKYFPTSRGTPPGQESSAALVRTTSLGRFSDGRPDLHAYRHQSKQHAPTSIQSLLN